MLCVRLQEFAAFAANFVDMSSATAISINPLPFSLKLTNEVLLLSQCAGIKPDATETLFHDRKETSF